jgi:hypothetical protein
MAHKKFRLEDLHPRNWNLYLVAFYTSTVILMTVFWRIALPH